jgi:lysyl-tRNA synthetase class 2
MANLKELRDERLRKLQELKKLGVNPYPAKSTRTHLAGELVGGFETFEGESVTVAGRIVGIRKFGKLAFVVLRDASGDIQLFLKEGDVQQTRPKDGVIGLEHLNLLDAGDFIEAIGTVGKTKTGEVSVLTSSVRLLTKSLRGMPTPQEGFTNKEERMRRRYVDLNVNPEVRERFLRRSKFWQATRDFLNNEGFTEINIPILEQTTGGADANPFVTHMDALDQDFYLRISHELPLKRLLGGGYEKVYDIGPRFRNENYSDEHLPEHVAMEWYWAYADWQDGMKLTQRMIRAIADVTWGTRKFTLSNGMDIDLGPDDTDWPRVSFVQLLQDRYGLDVHTCTLEQAVAELKKIGGEVERIDNRSRVIDKLWKKIRVEIAGPAFLVDIPDFLQPLAKLQADDPRLTEQFNLMLGGTEACKAYSELNDPIDQLQRFVEQQQMRDAGDDEAMMLDIDFVEMLEYAMPPACGYGHSERIFWMLEGVTAREGVIFPQLRRETDESIKKIYPEVWELQQREAAERPQNFGNKITLLVDKTLEPWQMANAVAHMSGFFGNNIAKSEFVTADSFVTKDGKPLPRNSQYPIIIKRASEKDLHKTLQKARDAHLKHHVFIKEMQDTNVDAEIVETLRQTPESDVRFYGLGVFGPSEQVDALTKHFQLWK